MAVLTPPSGPGVLSVKNLVTVYPGQDGEVVAVDDVSFELSPGEVLGIVGDSGSGKTTLARSLLGLVSTPGRIIGGEIKLHGRDLLKLSHKEMREIRGKEIGMIFQNPIRSFHPGFTIGWQLIEAATRHTNISRREATENVVEALTWVGMPEPTERINDYPHQFSGGMLQRVMIAMSLLNEPAVLIADEPTTALDVTIQSHILELIRDLIKKLNFSVLLITHNLGVVAEICDRVAIMNKGKIVEQGDVSQIFNAPSNEYTKNLLNIIHSLYE